MIKLVENGSTSGGVSIDHVFGQEIDTGRTWEGSTVYTKTIDVGNSPNTGTKNVAHGITNLGTVIEKHYMVDNGTFQLQWVYHNSSAFIIQMDDTNLTLVSTNNQSAYTGKVILYYTKTS